jgi:peptide chain release factor 1
MEEMAQLQPVAELLTKLVALEEEQASLQSMLQDETDAELREMAEEEHAANVVARAEIEQRLLLSLIPRDDAEDASGHAILEVRSGAGGDEASLFAEDLMDMYAKAADQKGWRVELLDVSPAPAGLGYREAICRIEGQSAYATLQFESGVHRVQRVPVTETKGRIHTSTASVAILPEPTEVERHINQSDLRIDVYRSSGAGGQHVNTTESAVRITHLPTGLVAASQDGRSQHQNRGKAMTVLAARVYEARRRAEDEARRGDRQAQIGTGDRSERIRTYNIMQNRVTDHRIGLTVNGVDDMLAGGGTFWNMVRALKEQDQQNRLDNLASEELVGAETMWTSICGDGWEKN